MAAGTDMPYVRVECMGKYVLSVLSLFVSR